MASNCAGCLNKLPKREFLTCCLCKLKYDLECANVPIVRFNNTMTEEHKRNWKCQLCRCQAPKTDNSNTPLRPQTTVNSAPLSPNEGKRNVTIRNKQTSRISDTTFTSDDDLSILGNTATGQSPETEVKSNLDSLILTQLDKLLENKLEKNKQMLLSELKTMLVEEVTIEITNQIKPTVNLLTTEQQYLKKEINTINIHIQQLQSENLRLQSEIENLLKRIQPNCSYDEGKLSSGFEYSNKFVLYGLKEGHWETEGDLCDRVTYLFQDLMNINLENFIENINRIGKRGYTRPLVIELLSKKMVRNILHNKQYFKNTGLAITEYLDENQRQTRKHLRQLLWEARNNGKHAVLRNNKLIINGKEYDPLSESQLHKIPTTLSQESEYQNVKEAGHSQPLIISNNVTQAQPQNNNNNNTRRPLNNPNRDINTFRNKTNY